MSDASRAGQSAHQPAPASYRAIPVSYWLALLYLVSVGLHYRALRHQAGFPLLATDEAQYIAVAENLRLGHGFLVRGEFHSGLPPLYPLFIAAAHSFGPDPRMSALFFSSLFISIALFPAYGLARFVGLDRTLAFLAAAAAVLLPNTVLAGLYMTETLSYPLFLTSLLVVARWLETPSARWALIAGTLLSLMLLTKVAAFSFVAAVLVAVVTLSSVPRGWSRNLVRPGASALAMFGMIVITQLGWQAFKSWHGAAGLGMYGRVLEQSGLPHLSAPLLLAYFADFLLAPGLLVVVPLAVWFWRNARERPSLATLLAATLVLQVVIHGVLETGLSGYVQERLYMYSLPIMATIAMAGLESLAGAGPVAKASLVAVPLALLYVLGQYPFPYVPVLDVPWVAALGSPSLLEVFQFEKTRALLAAVALIGAIGLAILLLPGRRAQLIFGIFIVCFNLGGFVSSAKKMSVLSTMGRAEIVPIAEWLAAHQLKPNDKLIVCGGLAFFQDRHRITPADPVFVGWHRRFLPVITELQLESLGRFDLRLAPSPEEVSAQMMPGDRLLTATRMTGLRLVGYQYPLYLYTRDSSTADPIRPLYELDLTADLAHGWPRAVAPEQQTHTTIGLPMHLLPGTYRATLGLTGAPGSEVTLEVVVESTGAVLARWTGIVIDAGPLEFMVRDDEPVRVRITGPDRQRIGFAEGMVELVAPAR